MARQLWVLRHADAEPHGTRQDAQRRLTTRGEYQARIAGQAIKRLGSSFDAILVSPKVRAQQTAELAAAFWDEDQREVLETYPPLAGDFDVRQTLDALREVPSDGRLMLVGHEPDLSGVISDLTGARIDLKKGGLAVVRVEGAAGQLTALLRPSQLQLIARTD